MDIFYGLHLKNPAISLVKPLLFLNLDKEKHETSSWLGHSSPFARKNDPLSQGNSPECRKNTGKL